MTTSEYDELVKRLGRLADVIDNGGAVDFPDWASVREAADAITRLSRDLASAIDDGFKVELSRDALAGKLMEAQAAVASAHTAGAMLMREEAAKYHDAEAERYRARLAKSERCRPVNLEYCDDLRNALADEEQAARNIRALPLPSPVAVQAVPEGWKPIETAPMAEGQFVPVMLWIDGFNTPDIGGWLDDRWVTPDDYFDITGTPTHWRPLPPPPDPLPSPTAGE